MHLSVCYYHVTNTFLCESTLCSCQNVKELLASNRCNIWSLTDSNRIQTHKNIVCKQTLNHLTNLAKWLSCAVSTYLYEAFGYMLLSCHLCISEWICNLKLPKWQATPCLKQVRYLKSDNIGIRPCNHLVSRQTLDHLAKLFKYWPVLWLLICIMDLTLYYYHVIRRRQLNFLVYGQSSESFQVSRSPK